MLPTHIADEEMTDIDFLQKNGIRFSKYNITIFKNGESLKYWPQQDFFKIRAILLDKLLNKNTLNNQRNKVLKIYSNLIIELEKRERKLNQLIEEKEKRRLLWEIFDYYYKQYKEICGWVYSANLIDVLASRLIKEKLAISHPQINANQVMLILTRKPQANYVYAFELALIDFIKNQKSSGSMKPAIENFTNHWSGLFLGSIGKNDWPNARRIVQNYIKKFNRLTVAQLKKKKDFINQIYGQSEIDRQEIIKQHKIGSDVVKLGKLLAEAIYLKETKKFIIGQLDIRMQKLFILIGSIINVELHDLYNLLPSDIYAALMKNRDFNKEWFKKLEKNSIYLIRNGKTKRYIGLAAKQIEKTFKLLDDAQPPPSEAKSKESMPGYTGFVSSLGCVTGPVRLVMEISDFKKVKKGDILVTPITTPEYLIIFNKIAGMITYDGAALTSHPATLSREYKIPAILGVKAIKNKLKDGDIVTVDANNNKIVIH